MAFGDLKGTLTLTGASVGATNALAGSVSVSVGDLIFAVFGEVIDLTCTGATDNLGNTYTATNAGSDDATATGRAFYSIATAGGTLTAVTIAATASGNDFTGSAAVFTGPYSAIDANPANIEGDVTSPLTCPATGTLSQADESIIAWAAINPDNTDQSIAASAPNTLALSSLHSNTALTAIGYQTVSATTSVAPEFTVGAAPADSVIGTSSFTKAAPATVVPRLLLLGVG